MFKKGETVFLIQPWNRVSTVMVQECTVYSCGKKRMVLTSVKTGEEVGRDFLPAVEQRAHMVTVHKITREEAKAKGLEVAAAFLAHNIAHLERRLAEYPTAGEGYRKAIQSELDLLNSPATVPQIVER